jgi:hypothetical protein
VTLRAELEQMAIPDGDGSTLPRAHLQLPSLINLRIGWRNTTGATGPWEKGADRRQSFREDN